MDEETKNMLAIQLELLKKFMKQKGLIFAFMIDENDYDKSKLAFMDKESLMQEKKKGIAITLRKLNEDLI